jgi:hypothetical protein
MSSADDQIWLSRESKTEGPFTTAQIEAMKSSGELKKYTWIWSGFSKSWAPLNPPPPPPSFAAQPKAQASAAQPPVQAPKPAAPARTMSDLSVICHDNRSIVAGVIGSFLGTDSVLKSSDYLDMLPPFKKGAKVLVNLLDEKSGKTENAQAEIVDFKKTNSKWEYRLKWSSTPKLIGH